MIRLKTDLLSGNTRLPEGTILHVILHNRLGARAAAWNGNIHIIHADDFDWV